MSTMEASAADLLASAVRAAILAKAPRRTVQAVAAAVAGVLGRPATSAAPAHRAQAAASAQSEAEAGLGGASPEALLEALRSARREQRRRKKERRRARRAASSEPALSGAEDVEIDDTWADDRSSSVVAAVRPIPQPIASSVPAPLAEVAPPVARVGVRHFDELRPPGGDPTGSGRVFVGNIGPGTTKDILAEHMGQAGLVFAVIWPPLAKGCATVIYVEKSSATRAAALNKTLVAGSKQPLSVRIPKK